MRGEGPTVKGITFFRKRKLEKRGRKYFEAREGERSRVDIEVKGRSLAWP